MTPVSPIPKRSHHASTGTALRTTTPLLIAVVSLSCLAAFSIFLLSGNVRVHVILQRPGDAVPGLASPLSAATGGPSVDGPAAWHTNLPTLIIYRRSMKTGSTSMVNELIRTLTPLNYEPAHARDINMVEIQVRGNYHRLWPKRYMIVRHNRVTKADAAPWARTLVVDTLRDGYEQVTSFCRYMRKVRSCGSELAECMLNSTTLDLNRYRWAGRQKEDKDTYIDIPLISKYPALSTTLMRRVFPNITLNLQHYRAVGAKCERNNSELVKIYDEKYQQLERQVQDLRHRMLVLAGYPTDRDDLAMDDLKWDDIFDVIEKTELRKYEDLQGVDVEATRAIPEFEKKLDQKIRHWTRGDDGKITITLGPKYKGK